MKRSINADMLKGLLILFVVIGHHVHACTDKCFSDANWLRLGSISFLKWVFLFLVLLYSENILQCGSCLVFRI